MNSLLPIITRSIIGINQFINTYYWPEQLGDECLQYLLCWTFRLAWWSLEFGSKAGWICAQSIALDKRTTGKDKDKILQENQVLKWEKCKVRPILDNKNLCGFESAPNTKRNTGPIYMGRFIRFKTGVNMTSPVEETHDRKAVFVLGLLTKGLVINQKDVLRNALYRTS